MTKTTKSPARRRAVILWRVSRKGKRGGDSYHTEAMQVETCQAYAKAKGIRVVAVLGGANRSGGKGKMKKNEALQEALGMLERGEADCIIVAKLSRFARSVKDAMNTLDLMESWGATLVACDIDLDTSTPGGRLLRTILFAVAELEIEMAAERWEEVREHAASQGIYVGKAVPGYRKNGGRELVVDKKVEPLVRQLFIDRGAGVSWAELHRRWQAAGGPKITWQGLHTIVGNRLYMGTEAIDAIVSPEQWEAAQSVKAPRPKRKTGSLLAGIVSCSVTGNPMTSSGNLKVGAPAYKCQPGRCHGHKLAINQARVDKVVEEQLLARAGELALEGTGNGEHGLLAAIREREAAEGELTAFVRFASALDVKTFQLGLDERQARVDEAIAAEVQLKGEHRAENVLVKLAQVWPDLGTEEKRRLVAAAVERVEIHPSAPGSARGGNYASEEKLMQLTRDRVRVVFRSDV